MQTRLSRSDSRRMRSDLESAIEHLPGLASLALWCNFADTDEETIAFTDGKTIYAGKEYENFSDKERRFICLHEILHIALCHPHRFSILEKRDAEFNPQLLNIAADAIINQALENLTGLKTPMGAWSLDKIWQVLEKSEEAPDSPNKAGMITPSYSYYTPPPPRKIANLTRAEFTQANRWSGEELYYFLKAQAQKYTCFLPTLIVEYAKDALGGDLRPVEQGRAKDSSARADSADKTEHKRDWQQRLALLRGTMPELYGDCLVNL